MWQLQTPNLSKPLPGIYLQYLAELDHVIIFSLFLASLIFSIFKTNHQLVNALQNYHKES